MKKLIIKVTEIQTVQLRDDGEFLKLYISFSVGNPLYMKWEATSDNVARAKNTYDTIRKALAQGSSYAEVIDDKAEYNRVNERIK
jgi:hypothetical protein